GVLADETRTALIATGCIAGGLLLIAVIIAIVVFTLRHIRNSEKKPLSSMNGEVLPQGVYRGPEPYTTTLPRQHANGGPKTKSYTHHAASPRSRQPLTFYTIRAEPRAGVDPPGLIPMGPTQSYRGPPPVGRPVIFLDWNGAPKGPQGEFMYPNGGTMLYYGL
ncbi:unnamed protein product, partial [Lymnaea stagnalis]